MNVFLSFFLFSLMMININSRYVDGKGFKGYIFEKEHFVMISIENQANRYTPTKEDVLKVEELIKNNLEKLNTPLLNQGGDCPVIHKKLKKYVRQYVGFVNKGGEKVVWVNFIWHDKDREEKFSNDIYNVLDGCSYYWQIKVNINKQELFDLSINGSV